jgi:hypothetical protein
VTIWVLPAAVVAVGALLVLLRTWSAWQEAEALRRSLVALRTISPSLQALRAERAALAAGLDRITPKSLVSSAHRR